MNVFLSRNHFYIDDALQSKIIAAKIVFLGTGLSSTLAEVMVRTGFTNLFLCDGDKVEVSNLNRQNFEMSDIGQSKVIALQKRLKAINPNLSCSCLEKRFESLEQIEQILSEADIIVNTIDCGSLYFDVIDTYRKKNKLIICPFNPGFGGLVVCFTEESTSSFEFFETDKPLDDFEIARHLLRKVNGSISAQADKTDKEFLDSVVDRGYFPQLSIGANLTAAITVTAAVDYLKGKPILTSPDFYYLTANAKRR